MTKTMKVEGPLHVVCQCDKCKAQAQEYVALWYFNQGFGNCMINKLNEAAKKGPAPIYLVPPQRTWVGLTEEDKHAIEIEAAENDFTDLGVILATEAKLKAKNSL